MSYPVAVAVLSLSSPWYLSTCPRTLRFGESYINAFLSFDSEVYSINHLKGQNFFFLIPRSSCISSMPSLNSFV